MSLSERVKVFAGTNGPLFINLTPDCKTFAWEKLLLLNKCLHANIPIQIVINTLWYQKKNHSRWGEIYMPSKNIIIRKNYALSVSSNRNSTSPSP